MKPIHTVSNYNESHTIDTATETFSNSNPAVSFHDPSYIELLPTREDIAPADFNPILKKIVLKDCIPSLSMQSERECVPAELRLLKIPSEEYETAMKIVRQCSFTRNFNLFNNKLLHFCVLFILFMVAWVLITLSPWRTLAISLPLPSLVVIAAVVLLHSCRKQAMVSSQIAMVQVNELCHRHHIIAGLVTSSSMSLWPTLSVIFIHTDIRQCMHRLSIDIHHLDLGRYAHQIQEITSHLNGDDDVSFIQPSVPVLSDSDTFAGSVYSRCDSRQQEFAHEVALFFCNAYVSYLTYVHRKQFSKGDTPSSFTDLGHSAVLPCLCQYITSILKAKTKRKRKEAGVISASLSCV